MVDPAAITQGLSATSSVAVVAGAFFIVFQLRQNAKEIGATVQENKANTSIALIEKITDETFEPLVKHLKERYGVKTNNWSNFEWLADETLKDMQARETAHR